MEQIRLLTTLLLVLVSAVTGGVLAKKVKQPALVGYIGAGVLFGRLFPQLTDEKLLTVIADSGVTLLLFTLGVEFSFHKLRQLLGNLFWVATTQIVVVLFVFLVGLVFAGFPFLGALFIAAAAAISSTAVVVRLLSERGELETVPGDVATAWLVIQDLAVVPMMILLPTMVSVAGGEAPTLTSTAGIIVLSLVKSVFAIAAILYLGRIGVPRLLNRVAALGNREVFLLTTIGLVFLAAVTFYSVGLSAALGAFVAGLLVADTSQNHEIFAEVRPLRDLFAVVFFVSVGMMLPVSYVVRQWPMLLAITAVLVIVKMFLVYGLTRFAGFHRKTAFLVAVFLLPMSEFGFIIAREGVRLGALSADHYALLVALVFLTILIAAPFISGGHAAYYWLYRTLGGRWPRIFPAGPEQVSAHGEELPLEGHIVICGFGRVGRYIGRALEMAGIPFVVVDYNQATVAGLKSRGTPVVYGDPADKEVLDYAQVDRARALIVAIPDRHTQEMIIAHAQTLNRRIKIICRTHHEEDQRHLKSLGVTIVVQPEFEAAIAIVTRVLGDFGVAAEDISGKISRLKIEHGLG